ncbi:MAG: prolyl aminopeptidase [Gammaproteobacteria bacterium]
MPGLYPRIKPYATHQLEVDPPHVLYVEESGSPEGIPIVFVHGGPGAGCLPYHRTFFDPEVYRIILFDQRGCGRSVPHAELEGNTTQALVADMERIREMLGIERWILFGGSWGSTLSLVYAQTHPEKVMGLILRGIFLCRPSEIQWFYQSGAHRIFPDHWEEYVGVIPEQERDDMVGAYYKRLTGENELARMGAAKAWARWEAQASTLQPSHSVVSTFTEPYTAMSLSRIECHYFINNSFLEPDQILKNAPKLADIPGIIVHGRYDIICPMENAWQLHQAWPDSQLQIIPDAGHAASERSIADALVRATRQFADRFGAET